MNEEYAPFIIYIKADPYFQEHYGSKISIIEIELKDGKKLIMKSHKGFSIGDVFHGNDAEGRHVFNLHSDNFGKVTVALSNNKEVKYETFQEFMKIIPKNKK